MNRMVANPFYFLDETFWDFPALVVLFVLTLFVIVLSRYLITAYVYHVVSFKWLRKFPIPGNKQLGMKQWRKEIRWSLFSSLIFSVLVAICFWAYQHGLTKVYTSIADYSVLYFFFSIVLMLILYETYYYWLHRWMHHPRIFRIVHKVHHESTHTSAFTSFSFHPLEALLQFLFIPLLIITIPVHYAALGIVLLLMTLSAVINHAGVEIFPKYFANHPIGKWIIGATHHDIHHKQFRKNFGLYFTFWDKWMKTESENYEEEFRKNTAGRL
jgi:Delta7-sterol 5-desaturase